MSQYVVRVKMEQEVIIPVDNEQDILTKKDLPELLSIRPDVLDGFKVEIDPPRRLKKYMITLRPRIEKYIEIEAATKADAVQKLSDMWNNGTIDYAKCDEMGQCDVLDIDADIKDENGNISPIIGWR